MFSLKDGLKKSANASDTDSTSPMIVVELKTDSLEISRYEMSVLNINDTGMGVACDHLFKVGQVVTFTEDQQGWDLPEEGVIMWTYKTEKGFQAGIKFL